MNIVLNGLVLRSVDYKDADRILTVLTLERGKITVRARGARRKNSPLAPLCQILTYMEMTLFESRGRYVLDSAFAVVQFGGMAQKLENMALGCYFLDLLSHEPEESRIDEDVMRLALNALYALSADRYPLLIVKSAFELKYMQLCGYMPELSIERGLCMVRWSGAAQQVDRPVWEAIAYILRADPKRLFLFSITGAPAHALYTLCERHVQNCFESRPKTLDYFGSVYGALDLGADPGSKS